MTRRLFMVVLLFSSAASAATFLIPSDEALVRASTAIVIATAGDSFSRWAPGGWIETVTELHVEEAIKGPVHDGDLIRVTELGGSVGQITYTVPGSPRYAPSERVLLFLETNDRGEWVSKNMAIGKFAFVRDAHGRRLLVREASEIFGWDEASGAPHREQFRNEERFLHFVRETAAGRQPAVDYNVSAKDLTMAPSAIATASPAASTYVVQIGLPIRRSSFPVVFFSHGTQPGAVNGGLTALQNGMSAWTNDPDSNIVLSYGGTTSISNGGFQNGTIDGFNTVQFNDPSNEIPGSFSTGGATLAVTQMKSSGATHNAFGETFLTLVEADLVVQDGLNVLPGISGPGFDHTIAHELGHTIGLRHSDEPPPGGTFSSTALMNSTVDFNFDTSGATLQAWDHEAIAAVYGAGPVPTCNPPTIILQPQSVALGTGPVVVSVTASGDTPLHYQWYIGATGNISQPINGATGSAISVQPNVTTSYWVRVSNACGSLDSTAATVTVNGCPGVNITSLSSSTSIIQGKSTTLSVAASGGSGLSYQWFIGSPGVTTTTAGSGSSITVQPGLTTSYWVRATNSCGAFADSDVVVVTVQPCNAPAILVQPAGGDVLSGSSAVLFVGDSGTKPEAYQWYEGKKGDTSIAVPNATAASFSTPLLLASTSYWVRITNDCGTIDSASAQLNVVPTCQAATIVAQPTDQTVTAGATAIVKVVAAGTSLLYQWYQGPVFDFTRPVGGSAPALVTAPINAPIQYWVRITAPCGSVNSVAVTVSPSGRRRPSHS